MLQLKVLCCVWAVWYYKHGGSSLYSEQHLYYVIFLFLHGITLLSYVLLGTTWYGCILKKCAVPKFLLFSKRPHEIRCFEQSLKKGMRFISSLFMNLILLNGKYSQLQTNKAFNCRYFLFQTRQCRAKQLQYKRYPNLTSTTQTKLIVNFSIVQ